MKKTISVYIIFGFLLTSFAGCGKLKSSPVSGLNQSDTSASKVDNQPEKVEPVKQEAPVKKEEAKQLELVKQVEPKTVKPTLLPEPSATPKPSIKDLTAEEIFELAEREKVEILERELKLFDPKDIHGYGTHQIVIDQRNSLVTKLMDARRNYYNYLLKGKNNNEQ
jgi:hypothetical protein